MYYSAMFFEEFGPVFLVKVRHDSYSYKLSIHFAIPCNHYLARHDPDQADNVCLCPLFQTVFLKLLLLRFYLMVVDLEFQPCDKCPTPPHNKIGHSGLVSLADVQSLQSLNTKDCP